MSLAAAAHTQASIAAPEDSLEAVSGKPTLQIA
jgi:hypothetical protein